MSISWGMLADIDLKSENLRFMGGVRFTVAAVAYILR
ncbi:unnamed protein product [Protopolystoma xenopodis]|uniref:Uncharacterized protein n=1 Tax=Protopolystoma xenopodis TaxID=117903 RepID=A0A3S5CGR7_9PLAT|nr:unnamed protein product [Protopolystoma xenopodis]